MVVLLNMARRMLRVNAAFILFCSTCPSQGGDGRLFAALARIEHECNSNSRVPNAVAPAHEVVPDQQIIVENTVTNVLFLIDRYTVSFASYCLSLLPTIPLDRESHLKKE